MVPFKSTTEEVSFKWSHQRISSTDSKVRTTQRVSITETGSDRTEEVVTAQSCGALFGGVSLSTLNNYIMVFTWAK